MPNFEAKKNVRLFDCVQCKQLIKTYNQNKPLLSDKYPWTCTCVTNSYSVTYTHHEYLIEPTFS